MSNKTRKISPLIPLVYSLAGSIGRYALFLGAGVSKDAGVPSGKDIFDMTVNKLQLLKAVSEKDKKDFYMNKTYGELVEMLFPSNEEQRKFLSDLFKPHSPGASHRNIAKLIKGGYFKYIITSNFDTLLENALDEIGLKNKYTVITEENILSSKPWMHEEFCRIYKVHGTIESGHIRNTRKDIAKLPGAMAKHLSEILESHGLVVVGYSADEDAAFDKMLMNRQFKGYSMYWTDYKHSLQEKAMKIIGKQDAHVIAVDGAGEFFGELNERIFTALNDFSEDAAQSVSIRFKNLLLSPSPEAELMQAIDAEKRNLLDFMEKQLASTAATADDLWAVFNAVFNQSYRYILFTEQVIKYYPNQFMRCASLLDEIFMLTSDDYNKNSVVYYLFFCLLEIIGAVLIENRAYVLLGRMLKMKRLNFKQDAMDNILGWNVQVDFLHRKSQLFDDTKPITLMFHHLLELAGKLPLRFNIKERLLETDILFLVYSVKYQLKVSPPYWFARAPVYCNDMPKLFYQIKHDYEFAKEIAEKMFETSAEELFNYIHFADKLINNEFSQWYSNSLNAKRVLKNF